MECLMPQSIPWGLWVRVTHTSCQGCMSVLLGTYRPHYFSVARNKWHAHPRTVAGLKHQVLTSDIDRSIFDNKQYLPNNQVRPNQVFINKIVLNQLEILERRRNMQEKNMWLVTIYQLNKQQQIIKFQKN